MRRLLCAALALLLLAGCAQRAGIHTAASEGVALDLDALSEAGFEARVQEVLADTGPYEGALLRMTGQYAERVWNGARYRYLVRPSGTDGSMVGFELQWDGAAQEGDTLTVEGALATYLEGGARYAALEARRVVNRSALERAGQMDIPEEDYLTALRALYDAPEAHMGAAVRITGRFHAETVQGCAYLQVLRAARYSDGSTAPAGLEFTWDGALPEDGSWITVEGTLGTYDYAGETILTLEAYAVTPAPAGLEPVCDAG